MNELYAIGTVYIIKCKNKNILNCYISSTNNFDKMNSLFKYKCNNNKNKLYQFIRASGGVQNWEIKVLSEYENILRINLLINERIFYKKIKIEIKSENYKIEYRKIYNKKNKIKLSIAKSTKYKCICGNTFNKSNKARHMKTKKHIKYLESLIIKL